MHNVNQYDCRRMMDAVNNSVKQA